MCFVFVCVCVRVLGFMAHNWRATGVTSQALTRRARTLFYTLGILTSPAVRLNVASMSWIYKFVRVHTN